VSFTVIVFVALGIAWLVISMAPPRLRAALWVVVILIGVIPWRGWQGHEHWSRVTWIPFSTAITPLRPRDLVVNVLLYAPLGFFLARDHLTGRGRWALVIGLALALSVGTEVLQVYSHGRFPSATDVVMNVAGSALGAALARRRAPVVRAG
jgi:glycopeptide antibiotics resistance protein